MPIVTILKRFGALITSLRAPVWHDHTEVVVQKGLCQGLHLARQYLMHQKGQAGICFLLLNPNGAFREVRPCVGHPLPTSPAEIPHLSWGGTALEPACGHTAAQP